MLPDAVLLDRTLPGLKGTEALRWIRQESQVPVLMVSVRDGEKVKVIALKLGGDDFITKPFSVRELVGLEHLDFDDLRHRERSSAEFAAVDQALELYFDIDKWAFIEITGVGRPGLIKNRARPKNDSLTKLQKVGFSECPTSRT